MKLRAIVVDDHALVAEGLRMMLEGLDVIDTVEALRTGEEALMKVQAGDVHIVLMDVNLGKGMNGLEACRNIKADSPATKVVILTMFTDPATVREAVRAGADGYLSKGSTRDTVENAIQTVIEGKSFLDPTVTSGVFGHLGDREPSALSDREQEVLQHLSEGQSTHEIAEKLFLSEETVKTHLKQIFKKLEVRDRTEAVAEAFRRGLVH